MHLYTHLPFAHRVESLGEPDSPSLFDDVWEALIRLDCLREPYSFYGSPSFSKTLPIKPQKLRVTLLERLSLVLGGIPSTDGDKLLTQRFLSLLAWREGVLAESVEYMICEWWERHTGFPYDPNWNRALIESSELLYSFNVDTSRFPRLVTTLASSIEMVQDCEEVLKDFCEEVGFLFADTDRVDLD